VSSVAANVYSFAMWSYLKNVKPEPLQVEKLKFKLTIKAEP
jgi:hypothetical protein